MSNTSTTSETALVCANCGKDGSDVTNTCNKCNSVMYCNAACKKRHRTKHKKACERRVAEFHDEKLFKQPPPMEDCPICFLRLPSVMSGSTYMSCCGKMICTGCTHAPVYDNEGNVIAEKTCPFCRTPNPITNEELIKRYEKRMELNDATAIYTLGVIHDRGSDGFRPNQAKALKLWHRAAELGFAQAYHNLSCSYNDGSGVEVDQKKAKYYLELAAMKGSGQSRHNLGVNEEEEGRMDRALKHYIIATKDGCIESLECIKMLYSDGYASRDDYANALRSYQAYLDEIKSDQRDEAAAADDGNRYYESQVCYTKE